MRLVGWQVQPLTGPEVIHPPITMDDEGHFVVSDLKMLPLEFWESLRYTGQLVRWAEVGLDWDDFALELCYSRMINLFSADEEQRDLYSCWEHYCLTGEMPPKLHLSTDEAKAAEQP